MSAQSITASGHASQNTNDRWFLAILLVGIALGVAVSLTRVPSVFQDGGVHPLGNDASYHATRMLLVAQDPTSTYAFDPNLHWPEGSWISWPWAYDYLAGVVVGTLSQSASEAAKLIVFYPIFWLVLSITAVALIARETLSPPLQLICLVAFATAPLTLKLFGVGELDHHGAELAFFITTIYLTGQFLRRFDSGLVAGLLGISLALATTVNNSLFIAQVPMVVALLWCRLRGLALPSTASAGWFAAALISAQVVVLLPSYPFSQFEYAFYRPSWFHLHVAALTSIAVFTICGTRTRAMWALMALLLLLALPAMGQVVFGLRYLDSDISIFSQFREAQRPFNGQFSIKGLGVFYSGLIFLTPLCMVYAGFVLVRRPKSGMNVALMIGAMLGLLMLSNQVRFFNFGYVFLILLPLMAIQELAPQRIRVFVGLTAIIIAYLPSLGSYLTMPVPGGSVRYAYAMPIFRVANTLCRDSPGLLLADNNYGSYFRYRTSCPLISSNFVISVDEVEYIRKTRQLLDLTPDELLTTEQAVRYVFVSPLDPSRLGEHLLSDKQFPGFELMSESRDFAGAVKARLFRVNAR